MQKKLFTGLRSDRPFLYRGMDTLLVEDDELGLCKVDLTKRPSEQVLEPVNQK